MSLDIIDETCTKRDLPEPSFRAIDELRDALDITMEQGNERVSGLLLIAIRDLADTVDLNKTNNW
jgi:hypothetical protein